MTQETNEVSEHEAKIFSFVKSQGHWVTSKHIAHATQVTERTVQNHVKRLVQLGIFDLAEVFPAHRFRVSEKASKRNIAYLQRLEFACEVFSIPL
jgi:FixJ family two-component response regulator